MRRLILVSLLAFGLIFSWTLVYAGDFYVIPVKGQVTSWDKIIPGATRFKLVLNDQAVLDKETGLVWEQSPNTTFVDWYEACSYCYTRQVGGRKGWRLPTIEELASLVDTTQSMPALPAGHPFTIKSSSYFNWTSTTDASNSSRAWYMFDDDGSVGTDVKNADNNAWCVRGGYGHDAY